MILRSGRLFGLVFLAIATGLGAIPSAGRADDDNDNSQQTSPDAGPSDLKLEYVGLKGQDADTVWFTVTNNGKDRSPTTTLTVETLSPPPSKKLTIPVNQLDKDKKAELSYELGTPCDRHRVRATLDLAGADATVDKQVCEPKAASSADSAAQSSLAGADKIDQRTAGDSQPNPFTESLPPDTVVIPVDGSIYERGPNIGDLIKDGVSDVDKARIGDQVSNLALTQVGQHFITRKPVAVRRLWERYAGQGTSTGAGSLGVCTSFQRPGADADASNLMVGWEHTAGTCRSGVFYQTAFKFDFSDLYQFTSTASAGALDVVRADLAWENVPGTERSSAGETITGGRNCMGKIGLILPGPEFDIAALQGPIEDYNLYEGVIYKSHQVDAFRVNRMIHYPTDNNGFLLRPVDESLFSADNSACVDLLSNFTLSFTYNINP